MSEKTLFILFFCVLLGGTQSALAATGVPPFSWPGGEKAAVSLSYDDALDSHLENAIPALNRFGLKGSFYLQLSNPSVGARMAEWRAAAKFGHELGNHTLFHQCSGSRPGRDWVQAHRNLDTTSAAQLKDQIVLANSMLHAIDGRQERTFTAPCGDLEAGGEKYLPTIKSEFVGIKAGEGSGIPVSMDALDLHAVTVNAPVGLNGKQLIALVKTASAAGTMLNLTFHGIGGDYLAVSKEAHEELLKYLAENRKLVWTDTFLNIMKHVSNQRRQQPR